MPPDPGPKARRSPASISGHAGSVDDDEECRADAIGVELLRASGNDPATMRQMLVTLQASRALSHDCRPSFRRPIERLTCVAENETYR
jgi:predicted Zn-dependent protease